MTGRTVARALALAAGVLALALGSPEVAEAQAPVGPTVQVRTVPAIGGVELSVDGQVARTRTDGTAVLPVRAYEGVEERLKVAPMQVGPDIGVQFDRVIGSPRRGLTVGLRTRRLVNYRFQGPDQVVVDPTRVSRIELHSNTGESVTVEGADVAKPLWLAASRTQQTPTGLISKDLYWTVSHVTVDGAEVVNKGQQKFVPNTIRDWTVKLLFHQVDIRGEDALFGSPAGTSLHVRRPDGTSFDVPLVDGAAHLANLPRGSYTVRVTGDGLSFPRPVGISKDQVLVLEVITALDLWLAGTVLVCAAAGLVLVGRRQRVVVAGRRLTAAGRRVVATAPARRVADRLRGRGALALRVLLVVGIVAAAALGGARIGNAAEPPARPPVLAYYYIWFEPTSWERAKKDYPLLGRYSSSDPDVMRRHLDLAEAAGIDGFLVSWKHTDVLDPRLATLVDLARARGFALGVVYQGLDVHRNPQPSGRIAEDLRWFAETYAHDPVFGLFGRPVVVITGTEQYGVEELERIVEPVRDRLIVLASAKDVEEYRRTAPALDGDAYYWSSADPAAPGFAAKLGELAQAVREDGGLWLAPAPVGFDARDLGGHRVVPREGGETLRQAMAAARASRPDAVAVISWNEFSENSHAEPSQEYGTTVLETLARLTGGSAAFAAALPPPADAAASALASDEAGPDGSGLPSWAALTVVAAGAGLTAVAAARARHRGGRHRARPGSGARAGADRHPGNAPSRDSEEE